MIVTCRDTVPAPAVQVAGEVATVLDRRAALKHPPATMAVSDAVALGIAGLFCSDTPSGRVLDRFYRNGSVDAAELIEAAQAERDYASPEGHAALHCLIQWVHAQQHGQVAEAR